MSASIVGIIVNVSPYVIELGRATSLKMMQVLDHVSRDRSLVTMELNAVITSNLVRAINTLVEEHKPGHGNHDSLLLKYYLLTFMQKTKTYSGLSGSMVVPLIILLIYACARMSISRRSRSICARKGSLILCSRLTALCYYQSSSRDTFQSCTNAARLGLTLDLKLSTK